MRRVAATRAAVRAHTSITLSPHMSVGPPSRHLRHLCVICDVRPAAHQVRTLARHAHRPRQGRALRAPTAVQLRDAARAREPRQGVPDRWVLCAAAALPRRRA